MCSLFFLVINSKYSIAKREMHAKEEISYCKKEGIDKVVDKGNSKRKALYGRRKSCILPSITNDLHLLAYERKKMSHYSEYNICTLYLL